MIPVPALGRTLLLFSLLAASAGSLVGFAAGARGSISGWWWTRRFAYAYAASILAANALMVYALVARDFSVSYVAQVGSIGLPTCSSSVYRPDIRRRARTKSSERSDVI